MKRTALTRHVGLLPDEADSRRVWYREYGYGYSPADPDLSWKHHLCTLKFDHRSHAIDREPKMDAALDRLAVDLGLAGPIKAARIPPEREAKEVLTDSNSLTSFHSNETHD